MGTKGGLAQPHPIPLLTSPKLAVAYMPPEPCIGAPARSSPGVGGRIDRLPGARAFANSDMPMQNPSTGGENLLYSVYSVKAPG